MEERGATSLPRREWIEEDRPREALFTLGTECLPLSKLLAIILRTGAATGQRKRENAFQQPMLLQGFL